MGKINISTRGAASWRERLAHPDRQWKRRFSAFEAAVSWERASHSKSGLPVEIQQLFSTEYFGEVSLLLGIAEHQVPLPAGRAQSQCDLWAILTSTKVGQISLAVEAKANEAFGDENLNDWFVSGKSEQSRINRQKRWQYIADHLPSSNSYHSIRYQLLHRCAASVIEAKRFVCKHACLIVQAFHSPSQSFDEYKHFCTALNIPATRGQMHMTQVGEIALHIGWADSPMATDRQVATALV